MHGAARATHDDERLAARNVGGLHRRGGSSPTNAGAQSGRPRPHRSGCVGRAPEEGHAVAVRAERGDRHTRLVERRGAAGAWAECRLTTESRPRVLMRATTVPSASSAMVDWPRTQSGEWNSASASVRAWRSSDSRRPACTYGCHQPRRSETDRSAPSRCQAGWPTDSPGPPPTARGEPEAASQRRAPAGVAASFRGERRGGVSCPTACRGGPTPRQPAARRPGRREACRRSHAPPPGPTRTAPRTKCKMPPRHARGARRWRRGPRARPAPMTRRVSPRARRGGAAHPTAARARAVAAPCGPPEGVTAEPHALIRLVDVGESATSPARHQADRPTAVLVDTAADADVTGREIARPVFVPAHECDPSGLGRARLEPVEGSTV